MICVFFLFSAVLAFVFIVCVFRRTITQWYFYSVVHLFYSFLNLSVCLLFTVHLDSKFFAFSIYYLYAICLCYGLFFPLWFVSFVSFGFFLLFFSLIIYLFHCPWYCGLPFFYFLFTNPHCVWVPLRARECLCIFVWALFLCFYCVCARFQWFLFSKCLFRLIFVLFPFNLNIFISVCILWSIYRCMFRCFVCRTIQNEQCTPKIA